MHGRDSAAEKGYRRQRTDDFFKVSASHGAGRTFAEEQGSGAPRVVVIGDELGRAVRTDRYVGAPELDTGIYDYRRDAAAISSPDRFWCPFPFEIREPRSAGTR